MNAYDTMLKALRDTLATMDANGVKLPATRIAIKHAIAKAEAERTTPEVAKNPGADFLNASGY